MGYRWLCRQLRQQQLERQRPSGTISPLAVTLADFYAVQQGDHVLVTWETASELNNRGCNLYRGTLPDGPDRQLNATLIPSQAQGSPGDFTYTWEDAADLAVGQTYFYWLDDVDLGRGHPPRVGERGLPGADGRDPERVHRGLSRGRGCAVGSSRDGRGGHHGGGSRTPAQIAADPPGDEFARLHHDAPSTGLKNVAYTH